MTSFATPMSRRPAFRRSIPGPFATRRQLLGRVSALAIAGSIGLVVATSAHAADALKPLDPPQPVKVAYVPIMKFAAAYVAESRGLFKKHGLDVSFEKVKSGTEAIAFLNQGSVDVGGIAIVASLWTAWSRDLDIRIIAPGGLEPKSSGSSQLLVRKDLKESGGITRIDDLKGKRIASSGGPGSGGEYLITKALERGKLTIRDVQMVNMGNPDMAAAFANKSVDAALAGSPYSDQIITAGTGVTLATDLAPGLMTVAFVGSGKFINQRPEVAQRFVLALAEATRLMQGEQYLAQPNIDAYMKFTNTTEAALRKGIPVIYDPKVEIPLKGLADIERVQRENGRTEYDKPLDMKKVIEDKFTMKAVELLGK